MELWDLYDKNGDLIGESHRRGNPLCKGRYHMVVSNWIINNKKKYLIQKRTKPLSNYNRIWSCTAGAAIKNEKSIEAVQRETKEELGLFFNIEEVEFIERTFFDDFFMDTYETYWNGSAESIKFDEKEVSDVKWATREEIMEMYANKDFYTYRTAYFERYLINLYKEKAI